MADYDDDDDDDMDEDDDRPIKKNRKPASLSENPFVAFLIFKKMVGPWLLVALYWFVVLGFIGYGCFLIVISIIAMRNIGAWALLGALGGVAVMIVGPITYRVVFELMIVVFRIHETLLEIRDNLK